MLFTFLTLNFVYFGSRELGLSFWFELEALDDFILKLFLLYFFSFEFLNPNLFSFELFLFAGPSTDACLDRSVLPDDLSVISRAYPFINFQLFLFIWNDGL